MEDLQPASVSGLAADHPPPPTTPATCAAWTHGDMDGHLKVKDLYAPDVEIFRCRLKRIDGAPVANCVVSPPTHS